MQIVTSAVRIFFCSCGKFSLRSLGEADVLVLDRFLVSLHRSQDLLLVGREVWAALWVVSNVQELSGGSWAPLVVTTNALSL